MTVPRTSTYALHQSTLGHMSRVSSILSNLQIQISSGVKSQNYAGISDVAGQAMRLEDQIASTSHFISNNSLIEARMQTTDNILSQLIDTATQLKSLIAQRRTEPFNVGAFGTQLEETRKAISSQLNTKFDGRYLFSGSKTDTAPIDLETLPVLDEDGNPSQAHYRGDDNDLVVNIDTSIQIIQNVRANDDGINKIFAALAAARTGDELNSDEKLVDALNFLDEGIDEIITLKARLNSNIVQIGETKTNLLSVQTYWKGIREEIVNTDLISASTQVAVNQGILQASFQAFAKINSLSLAVFLR